MATQYYAPQQGAPPPAMRSGKFVPSTTPEIISLVQVPGEMVPSEFAAAEVKYKLTDGRAWYAAQFTANQINDLRIAPRQPIEVTKTGRSKHNLSIVPLRESGGGRESSAPATVPVRSNNYNNNYNNDSAPPAERLYTAPPTRTGPPPAGNDAPTDMEALLEASLHQAQARNGRTAAPPATDTPVPITPRAAVVCAGMKIMLDAMKEGREYAQRIGLPVAPIDLRCMAATAYIQECEKANAAKGGH